MQSNVAKCSQMQSNVAKCSQIKSNGAKCSQIKSNVATCSQRQSNAVKYSLMQPNVAKCNQKLPHVAKCSCQISKNAAIFSQQQSATINATTFLEIVLGLMFHCQFQWSNQRKSSVVSRSYKTIGIIEKSRRHRDDPSKMAAVGRTVKTCYWKVMKIA